MSFESVARKIVANSIRSAICIDDEFVEPYKEKRGKVNEIDTPKQLRESFRKSNCSLDIYTYTSYRKLKRDSQLVFKNRDLLILDWELTDDPLKFKDALTILMAAVQNSNLAFVLIYTKEPDLTGIEMQIRSLFNQKSNSTAERDKDYDRLLSCLDDEFFFVEDTDYETAEDFFKDSKVKDSLKEFVMGDPSDEAIKAFETRIRKFFPDPKTGAKFCRSFWQSGKELYRCNDLFELCEQIEFHNRSTYIPGNSSPSLPYCYKIHGQKDELKHALWVHNTYITIFKKKELNPDSVYRHFSEYLCKKPGNIMTLIALEMKNNFRENSARVGKNLLTIDELAFFQHRRNLSDEEEFYDFLKNNWKHQAASFHLDSHSKVFPVMENYIKDKGINEKIDKRLKGYKTDEFRKELARLNFQFSFHHVKRKEPDYIRFGDIFSMRESKNAFDVEGYLINITAHCDCLRPNKINNNFYFVRGKIDSLENALKNANGENDLYSFLSKKNIPICITWETRPFTIFLQDKKRFFSTDKPIGVKIGKDTKFLFYEGTLLENYTQRIANKSFANAARVGVDLAELR